MVTRLSTREISTAPRPRLRVGFLLLRRFTLCAFANFVDVLRLAADEGDRSRPILCGWTILSDTADAVVSSCGIAVQPDARMSDPSGFDYLVVVGGLLSEIPNVGPAATRFLRSAAARHVPLVGLCTGAFVLHRAGLMDGYRCCVSWFHHADFLEQFDGLTPVSDRIFVIDRDRLTCSGGASSAHLAAHLVAKHVSVSAAQKSLQIMIIPEALGPEASQPGVPVGFAATDDAVRKALSHMRQNLEAPLAVRDDRAARRPEPPQPGAALRSGAGANAGRLLPRHAARSGGPDARAHRPLHRDDRGGDGVLRRLAPHARLQEASRRHARGDAAERAGWIAAGSRARRIFDGARPIEGSLDV